jgi:hypothetical protein
MAIGTGNRNAAGFEGLPQGFERTLPLGDVARDLRYTDYFAVGVMDWRDP